MFKFKSLMLVAGCVLSLVAVVYTAVPSRINFQGRLLDQNKNPKSGLFEMTFSIWDTGPGTGGSQIWSETQSNVQVTNGMFAVQLGAVTQLTPDVFSSDTRWLQIQVGSEVLSPRERLVSSPYALRASTAEAVVAQAITDAMVNDSAAIAWTKISKTGSSLADLAIKSASDLDSGTLSAARGGTGISGAGGTANRALITTDGTNWSAGKVSPETMIAEGNLPSNVIASSVAANSIHSDQIVNNTITNDDISSGSFSNITGVGTLSSLNVSGNVNLATVSGSLSVGTASQFQVSSAGNATFADGTLLDLSAINASATTEGLKLPQATNVSAGTAEGQIQWDTDDDLLRIGTGTGIKTFGLPHSIQVFTTVGVNTWTKPAGLVSALVITTGGGGGGGGAQSSDGTSGQGGGGGGAGGTCIELFAAADLGDTETVIIGAGGAGGAAAGGNGGAGGNSSFGAHHTANGGAGGTGRNQAAVSNAAPGGAGGTASGGNVNIVGGAGNPGFAATATAAFGGTGGASYFGGGAVAPILTAAGTIAGNAGTAYGSGGSGAVNINGTTGSVGGSGAPGVCIVLEYK